MIKIVSGGNMLKVFLVEDEYVVREGIKNNIDWAAHGFDFCGEAGDGELAYSMIQKEKPDIVFMDIVMPEKDGNEALSEIKAFDQDAVIIIVSSVGTQDQLKKAIQLGAKDFIQKPFEKNQISEIIELRLGGK